MAYNNLSGCIPNSGQFGSFAMDSYQGNSDLHKMSQGGRCSSSHGSGAGDRPPDGGDGIADDPVLYAVSCLVRAGVLGHRGVHGFPSSWAACNPQVSEDGVMVLSVVILKKKR